ncbi:precorrin-3B synthase [Rhizobium deserti]|uniref:Precorrin-3B synthase n=1 Tax=Rhizobium deserti TaxID=2547961 RepID=A0A4R5U894_9HYPH|nr:precorrin-3B synthase [Rhizobium deserti]TDK30312.1 precorrin-3B synthase [Rhizobium deserti]
MIASVISRPALDMRRGACPALSAPMMTGDGFLARVPLTDMITPQQLAEICRLALRHGNGILEISARGNLQIRGLTEASAPLLADMIALDLPLRDGLAVEVPPLAGIDETEIADPRPLAQAIADGAKAIAGLAPKMSVIVDGHGQLRLSDLLADIRLIAVSAADDICWKILLGGTEESGRVFNVLRETQAVEATLDLLRELSTLGSKARGRDLADNTLDAAMLDQGRSGMPASPRRQEAGPFGLIRLSEDLHTVGIGPALGQASAERLIALCKAAEALGIEALKPAFNHSLLFFGAKQACETLADFASGAGFIRSAADPRCQIAACPGSPACASATIATHDIAATAASQCGELLDGSFTLHVTGCAKGCAHPKVSSLSICGTSNGVSLIAGGKAADAPFASIAFADTNATLRCLSDLVGSERREGETSAACLSRLGPLRLAAATGQS